MAEPNLGDVSHGGEALPSFSIGLIPTGDPNTEFNADCRNDPLSPWQRKLILQRKDAFNIQCTAVDVIHGTFAPGSATKATLIILKFWFDKRRLGRRIASADIRVEFSGMDPEGDRPEVYAIAPHDKAALATTAQHQEDKHEANVHIGIAAQGAEGGGGYTWSRSVSYDSSDATTVSGSIDREGFSYGPCNCASWTLLENETRRTGVPSTMQVAVLLKRQDMDPFKCMVDVKAQADLKTGLEWFFGSKSYDEPVLFNPKLPPTNNMQVFNTSDLVGIIREPCWYAGLVGSERPVVSAGEKSRQELDRGTNREKS